MTQANLLAIIGGIVCVILIGIIARSFVRLVRGDRIGAFDSATIFITVYLLVTLALLGAALSIAEFVSYLLAAV